MDSTFGKAGFVLSSLVAAAIAPYFEPYILPHAPLASFLVVTGLLDLCLFILYRLLIYPFFLSPLRHLPQARGSVPLIGHAWSMFQRPPGQAYLKMMTTTDNDGLILMRGVFHSERLIVTEPAALADVLIHKNYDFEKPPWSRAFLKKFLGDGLLMTEGEEHRHHRKQIMPAFHFRHIKELYPVFWTKSIDFCHAVQNALASDTSKVLEIGHYATQVTLDIIGLAGLGRDIGSLRTSDDELITNYEEILEPTNEKAIYFILHLIFSPWFIGILPWRLNERVRITTSNLKISCSDCVVERKSQMKRESQENLDILSIMIRSNDFSDQNLVDQLLTFLAAGHETTSSSLTWASYLLSKHSEAQSRLRSEIYEAIPDPKALVDSGFDVAGVLENMPYLNAVCNEVLRLYPPIPVTARVSIRDTTVAGQFVPVNTMVFVVPWAINRNPVAWGSDAEVFRPERWIDETGRATMNGGAESNYNFITFLHGPRSCIGERFARAELRALIAALVGMFEFGMADPLEKVLAGGTITSKPVHGMKLKLTPLSWGLP